MKAWIDVGGTFTDCFVVDSSETTQRLKILSSGITKATLRESLDVKTLRLDGLGDEPDQFWRGFELCRLSQSGHVEERRRIVAYRAHDQRCRIDSPWQSPPDAGALVELHSSLAAPVLAVRRLLGCGLDAELPPLEVRLGTTRGTNALLTRSGSPVGLVVTRGFADLLRIGSQERPELFALQVCKPPPLTENVIEVHERLAADGSVLIALSEQDARRALEQLRAAGARSLAICLLHAYRNATHEQMLEELAGEYGFEEVSRSSEVAPLIKMLQRGETTTLDAYLNPILAGYVARVQQQFGGPDRCRLRLMTSGGQLVTADSFRGRDSVLSGPAGGVVALAAVGEAARRHGQLGAGVIGLDMGGTSTDVSRWEGQLQRQFEGRKAGVRILTPMMAIHTVAAGGGSICQARDGRLLVGPESAGADPGPACYGRGGPLTVTDINLALGRIATDRFPFQLDRDALRRRLREVGQQLGAASEFTCPEALAEGFWKIAINHMAEAVRTVSTAEGSDPRALSLVSFGGAAGQHACGVAEALGMRHVIDHPDASMLSALGMGLAPLGRFAARGIYRPLDQLQVAELRRWQQELNTEAQRALETDLDGLRATHTHCTAELRYTGADQTLEVAFEPIEKIAERFAAAHYAHYGYVRAGRTIELVTMRVDAELRSEFTLDLTGHDRPQVRNSLERQPLFLNGRWEQAARFDREPLQPGDRIEGPALICGSGSTLVVHSNWIAEVVAGGSIACTHQPVAAAPTGPATGAVGVPTAQSNRVMLEIVARRLQGIAEQMGESLRRSALSVNVKERLDYSCAVFSGAGELVAGAMHVPVHLGAMGHTVRSIRAAFPGMSPGDAYVSNNPYAGGSHLPDVTVVSPVFVSAREGVPDFFVASRAHHAEIGGIAPGSMPATAERLGEEGVVIDHFALVRAGESHEAELETMLRTAEYPSRAPEENMGDLAAQLAAGRRGSEEVRGLARQLGVTQLQHWMEALLELSAESLTPILERLGDRPRQFDDALLPGVPLRVRLEVVAGKLVVDFDGTAPVQQYGWNATPAIVSAAVLYVLRCLSDHPLPLNEGALRRLELRLPGGLLNPPAAVVPTNSPAVVAGNVETSQRIVDCLLGALGVAAASQGTMNNLLLGNERFGYYETICGGSGATAEGAGASAVHTHMTNTRITDAEILESRYPLRLWQFRIRTGSGGEGQYRGGDGVIRELEALAPLTATLLTSRRDPPPPFGSTGGAPGACGRNWLLRDGQRPRELPASTSLQLAAGDRLRLETPGGGGYGKAGE